jgi:hypothetical protein
VLALIAGLSLPSFGGAPTPAPAGFTDASLQGPYALVGIGDAYVATSIGTVTYDGHGRGTRALILNSPGPDQGRRIVRLTGVKTYTVHPDGTGTATVTETLPDSSTYTAHLDFVITQAVVGRADGVRVATEVFAMRREPGVAARLVTLTLKRLPD